MFSHYLNHFVENSPTSSGKTELIGWSVPKSHGISMSAAYREGSWLKVLFVCLCDSKVNSPYNLKSELKGGCGKNCVRVLGRGLFLNYFLSLISRRVSRQ